MPGGMSCGRVLMPTTVFQSVHEAGRKIVHAVQIPKPAFRGHCYEMHHYEIHGYRITPLPHPTHHLGGFALALEQENQRCQCFVMEQ